MSDAYVVVLEGLERLGDIANLPQQIVRKARIAVNETAEKTASRSRFLIRSQLDYTAQYLKDPKKGLSVTPARGDTLGELEARISGRERPRSLAGFAVNKNARPGDVTVRVGRQTKRMGRGAFLIKLRRGKSFDEDNFNLGLALRVRKGETLRNKKFLVQLDPTLYLLYGPSVNQAFRDVADKQVEPTAEALEEAFLRLLSVELK